MAEYLQTWADGGQAALERQGEQLEYAASNQYPRIGLCAGDVLYIGYLEERLLHLIGRMTVAEVINRNEARRRRGDQIWKSDWYAVADPNATGRILRNRSVPLAVVRQLHFLRRSGETTTLNPDSLGRLDGRALQAIRRLTPKSAELLGALL